MRNFSKQPFYRSTLNGGFVKTKSLMLNQKEPSLLSFRHYFHSWHGKCPNTELFLVHIFLYSDWIRRFGKSQNKGNKKGKHAKFSEKGIFLTAWYAHIRIHVRICTLCTLYTEQYGPEITLYLGTFHAVSAVKIVLKTKKRRFLLGTT